MLRRGSSSELTTGQIHIWRTSSMQKTQQPVQLNKAIITLHSGKAATDEMLQIIEAHPNWLTYAGVFEHPSPWLAYRHPIRSDMTSVDTVTQ